MTKNRIYKLGLVFLIFSIITLLYSLNLNYQIYYVLIVGITILGLFILKDEPILQFFLGSFLIIVLAVYNYTIISLFIGSLGIGLFAATLIILYKLNKNIVINKLEIL